MLVTGANGFVGRMLCAELLKRGHSVRGALRAPENFDIAGCEVAKISDIDSYTDWTHALRGINTVIHLAARVHIMKEDALDPLEEFRSVNVLGTERLARSASASGVRRLVYVSSIGVNGSQTKRGQLFVESDQTNPHNAYALSKWEGEQCLLRISKETGMEVVIVRPPLVYGPGVKGNFAQMLRALVGGIPLPLASVHNQRSLVYVENLVDALITCATHPAATGQTYLVSDGEDVSTPDLLRQLGASMGRSARLFPCPSALLKLAGRLIGKTDQIERLLGSLRVDSGKIRRELNWDAPYTLCEGLQKTGASVRNVKDDKLEWI
jgi:nucleoside-diphosphate-sugar epimerase